MEFTATLAREFERELRIGQLIWDSMALHAGESVLFYRSEVYVASDGGALFLSQAHGMRILSLDDRDSIVREVRPNRVPVGMAIVDGFVYLEWPIEHLAI